MIQPLSGMELGFVAIWKDGAVLAALFISVALGMVLLVISAVRLRREWPEWKHLGFPVIGILLLALPVLTAVKFEVSPEGIKAEFTTINQRLEELRQSGRELQREVIELASEMGKTLDLLGRELREPSGLTAAQLGGQARYAIVVDDENPGIFILEGSADGTVAHGPRHFDNAQFTGKDPDDLEALCFDGTAYFAISSHRRLGAKHVDERRLIRFELGPGWRSEKYRIRIDNDDIRDLGTDLKKALSVWGVSVDAAAWGRKDEITRYPRHPYAVEVEGLACSLGRLLLGFRWPLVRGQAIVVEYDWSRSRFVGGPSFLDLNGKGISSLEFDINRQSLFVVGNPPEKVWDDDTRDIAERYLGSSELFIFSLDASGRPGQLLAKHATVARRGAKLEGIAVVGDELWLAYDDRRPAVVRRPLSAFSLE